MKAVRRASNILFAVATFLSLVLSLAAQSNPVPFVSQPLVPASIVPGSTGFTLTVNGTGFVHGSVIHWNGGQRATLFASSSQLTATIPTSDVTSAGTAKITVFSPNPGGGTSNTESFEITYPTNFLLFSRSDLAAGFQASGVSAGDLNGDGNLDLITAGWGGGFGNTVSALLGNGDGTFRSHSDYTVGEAPWSVALGDFNGDGILDIAAISTPSDTVSVLLGKGDGTFLPESQYPVGKQPLSIAVADFNRDGKLDLAIANSLDSTVSILLGNGDGTFQPQATFTTGGFPRSVAIGDFNEDGYLDLVIANENDNDVSVLLGNGDGTFQPQATYATGICPSSVIVADFNGDGKLDLAVADRNCVTPGGKSSVSIVLGNGDGTFQTRSDFSLAAGAYSLAMTAGDFNGDGKLDVAVANPGNNTVSVLLGNGDGTLQPHVDYSTACGPYGISIGDFNGDGRSDIAVANVCSASSAASAFLQATTASVSPSSVIFSNQLVGTASATKRVALFNTGPIPMTVSSIVTTGDYSETNKCGKGVRPGTHCDIYVTFMPTTIGTRTGTLTLTDNSTSSPQVVSLTGTGTVVSLAPTSLSFAGQRVGTKSAPKKVTLINHGRTALSMAGITITGTNAPDFSQTNTCGTSVAAGANCTISVTFKPKAKGTRKAMLNVNDNGGGSPQTVSLAGTGT